MLGDLSSRFENDSLANSPVKLASDVFKYGSMDCLGRTPFSFSRHFAISGPFLCELLSKFPWNIPFNLTNCTRGILCFILISIAAASAMFTKPLAAIFIPALPSAHLNSPIHPSPPFPHSLFCWEHLMDEMKNERSL